MNPIALTIIIAPALIAAGIALYWYAFRFEPVNFRLSDVKIFTSRDDAHERHFIKSDPGHSKYSNKKEPVFTILHLSDFHLRKDRKGKRLFDFVQSLKVLSPDLLIITGDLVEKNEYFPYLVDMLSGFNSRLGKYAVFGVHDYYNKTMREFTKNMLKKKRYYSRENDVTSLIEKLDSIGIKVLRNESIIHRLGPETNPDESKSKRDKSSFQEKDRINEVQIIGVEDAIIEKSDAGLAFKEFAGALKEDGNVYGRAEKNCFLPGRGNIHRLKNHGKIRISMTHTPDMRLISELSARGADIILCGHTHGGQIRIPGLGALITGCKLRARYASGLFYFKDFVLYISRGLGEGRYSPFRFFCQPEASLIKIYNC